MRWCFLMARGMPAKDEMKILASALLVLIPVVVLLQQRVIITKYVAPTVHHGSDRVYFESHFDSRSELFTRWQTSAGERQINATHSSTYDGKWMVEVPIHADLDGDLALHMKSPMKHHAVSSLFSKPFQWNSGSDVIIQYEVAFPESVSCGAAYIKLLTDLPSLNLRLFNDRTPFTLLFGPERCNGQSKLHLDLVIPRCAADLSPLEGECSLRFDQSIMYIDRSRNSVIRQLDALFADRKSHLYTLVIRQSSLERSFEIYIDQQLFHSAPLSSLKPSSIYDFQEDPNSCSLSGNSKEAPRFAIGAIGIELLNKMPNVAFDNFIVTDSRILADEYARQTWLQKQQVFEHRSDIHSTNVLSTVLEMANETQWFWPTLFISLLLLAYYYYYHGTQDEEDDYSTLFTERLRAAAAAAAKVQPIAILKSSSHRKNVSGSMNAKNCIRRVHFADENLKDGSCRNEEPRYTYALQSSVSASQANAT